MFFGTGMPQTTWNLLFNISTIGLLILGLLLLTMGFINLKTNDTKDEVHKILQGKYIFKMIAGIVFVICSLLIRLMI